MNIMENKEKLQTRREFFKKAAKRALPILGVILLAGTPSIMKAADITPMDCNNSCKGSCAGGCNNGCYTSCAVGCKGGCHSSSN